MKIQIIKLDTYDDVISARDKISWVKTNRVLLVWTEKASVLTRRLDLVILNRYCQKMGVKLGLVSQLPPVVENAQMLGIPIFKTVKAAQKGVWRRSRGLLRFKRRPRLIHDYRTERPALERQNWQILQRPWFRLWVFGMGVIAVLILFLALLPEATIHLKPAHKLQEMILEVQADPDVQTVDYAGIVPARSISWVAETEEEMVVKGTTSLPDKPAEGRITFTNLGDKAISIPAGTIIRTLSEPAIRFVTTQESQIKGRAGEKIDVPVRALEPGKAGNVTARSIKAIEGNLGVFLSVNNDTATKGGTDILVPAADQSDYKTLEEKAIKTLSLQAVEQIKSQLQPMDQWLDGSLILRKIQSRTWDPPEGEPADDIKLTLRVEFEGYYVAGDDLKKLARTGLDAGLTDGYIALVDSLTMSPLQPPKFDKGEASWFLVVKRDTMAVMDDGQAQVLTTGRSPQDAANLLFSTYVLEKKPIIDILPAGWPFMPILPFRISVKVE